MRPEIDRFTATNVNVRTLIQAAHNVDADHLIGGPSWVGTPGRPSIFTALQQQLGLKLESTKDSMDVIMIDQVERPTPD